MRLSRRRLLALGALGVASAVLGGCGAPPAPAPTPTPTPTRDADRALTAASPVALTWATPGNPAELAVYERLARRVEAERPGLTITTSKEAADWAPFQNLLAAGTPPDLVFVTINNWPSLSGKSVLRPLDDFIKGSKLDLDDFYPQIIKPYRYDAGTRTFGGGALHGLPKEIAIRALYYNVDQFRAAGLTLPTADSPLTWDQFLDAARRTTRRNGDQITHYGFVPETWWGMWAMWAWANGGQVVDDAYKPTKATMDDPKVVQALTFWSELVTKHRVTPTLQVLKEQGRSDWFAAGKAAMYCNGRWMTPQFRQSSFTWDVMPMPRAARRAQLLTGSIFGVGQKTPHPETAWELLSYVTGAEGQLLMTELGVLLPSRRSVAESEVFLKGAPPASNRVFLDELTYAEPLPLHPRYPEMEKAVGEEVDLLLTGARTPTEVCANVTKRVNELLRA
jgi:multiple sugar transport system substrate-binding protein